MNLRYIPMHPIVSVIFGFALVLGSTAVTRAESSPQRPVKNLNEASPLVHWPHGFEPATADVFVHNQIWINARASEIWENLVKATEWPGWYSNSSEVTIEGSDRGRLQVNSSFKWKTFSFPVQSKVGEFEPGKRLGWFGQGGPDFQAYHAWLIVEKESGCEVITEETQLGAGAVHFNLSQPTAMSDAHHWWLYALKARCELASRR